MIELQELSWLRPAWDQASAHWKSLSHGILITGNSGIGKGHLALELSRLLLCTEPNEHQACGQCDSCQLLKNSVHPDLHVLVPEAQIDNQPEPIRRHASRYFLSEKGASSTRKPSRVIGVDAVRLLSDSLATKSGQGGRKLSLIVPADRLNSNSMNALLKLLEEPTADTYIILVSARPYRLAATIRSRCIQLECPTPDPQVARSWLGNRYPETSIDVLPFARCGIGPLQINEIVAAGEHGLFGKEEETVIAPAIEAARANGFEVEGPIPPDTAFLPTKRRETDLFVCMYHDKGHIPLKALCFDEAVNITLGLPIVRTSVDHGTALDIAGQGKANPNSLYEAVKLALKLI